MRWFEDYDNVTALGRWLVDDQYLDADELQAYYEKPWKWDTEYEAMKRIEAGEVRCEFCEKFKDECQCEAEALDDVRYGPALPTKDQQIADAIDRADFQRAVQKERGL